MDANEILAKLKANGAERERLRAEYRNAVSADLLPVDTLVWIKGRIVEVDVPDLTTPYQIHIDDTNEYVWVTVDDIIEREED